MSVSLEPSSQLSFRKPFNQLVKQTLRVNNNNAQAVAFKVKTTAPKLYCVRPNSGRVEAGESIEVQVLLQPMKEDPPMSLKCKDKFLVQSTLITPGKESVPLSDLWTVAAGDDPSKIHQQKLKVVYLPAEGTLPEEDEGEHAQSSMLSVDESKYETMHAFNGQNGTTDNPPIPVFDNTPPTPPNRPVTPPRAYNSDHVDFAVPHEPVDDDIHEEMEPVLPLPAAVDEAPSGIDHDRVAEYAARLADAHAEIAQLKEMLASANDLRRRKPVSDDGSVGMTDDGASLIEQTVQPEGVPLNVVAILSFVVFVVTYLFF